MVFQGLRVGELFTVLPSIPSYSVVFLDSIGLAEQSITMSEPSAMEERSAFFYGTPPMLEQQTTHNRSKAKEAP